jgi:CheY-like chemotaxis protein
MKHSNKLGKQPSVSGYTSAILEVEAALTPIEGAPVPEREKTAYATESKLEDHVGQDHIGAPSLPIPSLDIIVAPMVVPAEEAVMPEVEIEHTPNAAQGESTGPDVKNAGWPSSGVPGNGGNGGSYSGGFGGGTGGGGNHGGNEGNAGTPKEPGHGHGDGRDRRRRRRALISAPVRIRPVHVTDNAPTEVTTTVDVSRGGLFFITALKTYQKHMDIAVVFPYSGIPGEVYAEQMGHVVRVVDQHDGRFGIGVSFEKPPLGSDALVDAGGRKVFSEPAKSAEALKPAEAVETVEAGAAVIAPSTSSKYAEVKVLVVESDERARETMCSYLHSEGYSAMGVGGAAAAREILAEHAPAVLIAEIEGDGMLGYELCAYVKSEARLKQVPVILTTHSAYPSDYAKAHAVGAIICMAKPFKQEKLGHMVRLLAPPKPQHGRENGTFESRILSRPSLTARKPSGGAIQKVPSASKAKNPKHAPEFDKLCDEAVSQSHMKDRYDLSDTKSENGSPASEKKPGEQPRKFSVLRSLFKK